MAPEGLIEMRVRWPEHPRYLKRKKRFILTFSLNNGLVLGNQDVEIEEQIKPGFV